MKRIRYGILVLGIVLLLMAAGCGGSSSGVESAPHSVSAVQPSGLTLTLSESAATVPVGGSVAYTLTLTNTTDKTISGELLVSCGPGTGVGSVTINDPSGQSVTPPPVCGSASSFLMTLAPGQSKSGSVSLGSIFTTRGAYAAYGDAAFSAAPPTSLNYQGKTVGPLVVTVQ